MRIDINGEPLDVTLEGEKTLGEVLTALEAEVSRAGAAVVGVEVNGEAVEDAAAVAGKDLSTVRRVNLRAVTAAEVRSSLKEEEAPLKQTAAVLEELPVLLQRGKSREANQAIRETTERIDTVAQLVKLLALFPDQRELSGSLEAFFRDLTPFLKDFCDAIESGDLVGIGDLGEYEIKPRMETLIERLQVL